MIRLLSIILMSFVLSFPFTTSLQARVSHKDIKPEIEKELAKHTLEKATLDRKVKDCSNNTALKCDDD
jgi:hypothetical protein